tara:strand:+ start:67 stop:228 length:162 start_codon:yes stop_codon:yes gene_type:complete
MDQIGYNDVYAAFENLLDVMGENGADGAVMDAAQNAFDSFTENTIIVEENDED